MVGPADVPHAQQNPSSDEHLRFVSELRPPLVFEAILESTFDLAQDGKTTRQGIPKNPLQLAVLVDETRGMFYSSRVPVAIQEAFLALFAMLASVGRLVAYKARYADYTGPEDSIGVNSERTSTGSKSSKGGVVVAAILGVFLALLMLRWRGHHGE